MKEKRLIGISLLTPVILLILHIWNESQTGWDALGAGLVTLFLIIPALFFINGIILESGKHKYRHILIIYFSILMLIFGYFFDKHFAIGYIIFGIVPLLLGIMIFELVRFIKRKIANAKNPDLKNTPITIEKIPLIIIITTIIFGIFFFIYFMIYSATLL